MPARNCKLQTMKSDTTISETMPQERAATFFQEAQNNIHRRTDRLFAKLMIVQWLAGIATALWISPKTWIGATSRIHWHVWAAIFLGGTISGLPVLLAWKQPGQVLTRHVIAVGQMLTSALLVHLTGGRVETHFHIFGSLAFLAFYRDWRVLLTATVVMATDHMARGMFWPQSAFGVLTVSQWRWIEHTGWVIFEDTFLCISIRQSLHHMLADASQRARLETINMEVEGHVAERTHELSAAHKQLRASEHQLSLAFENAAIGMAWVSLGGRWLKVNRAFHDLFGFTPDELYRKTYSDLTHPRDLDLDLDQMMDLLEGKINFYQVEKRYFHRQGHLIWACLSVSLVRSSQGKPIHFILQIQDISDRKRVEERLTASLKEVNDLKSALDAHAIVAITDPQGKITYVNDRFCAISKYSREELVGHDHRMLNSGHHPKETFRDLWSTIARGQVWHGEIKNKAKDGTFYWVDATSVPFLNEHAKPRQYVAIRTDITERKRSEAELEEAHKELIEASRMAGMSEVATGVLHNVGNVLNSVNVSSTLVADNLRRSKVRNLAKAVALMHQHTTDLGSFLTGDTRGKQLPVYLGQLAEHLAEEQAVALKELAGLQKNIEHIKDIVAMQQSFAKVSGVTETIKVSDLIEDALRMNSSSICRHDIHVIKDYESVPSITVEKQKVLQILVNLVRNAKQACDDADPAEKRLTVHVSQREDRVRITVSDNGVGISGENLNRIFAHGFTTKKDGHGFGLHSGALAARELGGFLSVQSNGANQGAAFTLELPLQPSRQVINSNHEY